MNWNHQRAPRAAVPRVLVGLGGMNSTPGMLGWRVQVGERFEMQPLQSGMMVESLWMRIRAWKTKEVLQWVTPERAICRLKKTLFCHLQQ